MKLLTLNTHSLLEKEYREKLEGFARFVLAEKPDIIALQEVNQTETAEIARLSGRGGMVSVKGSRAPVRADNHALQAARLLMEAGLECSWAWLPVKRGYGKYDEGLAILSLIGGITETDICDMSRVADYGDWRSRMALGVRVEGKDDWFYTAHMGWWDDEHSPFSDQWQKLNGHLAGRVRRERVWLMGDFNAPAELRGEGYDMIAASGWTDTWHPADSGAEGATALIGIDGWRGQACPSGGMRIDHIWCSRAVDTEESRVVFNGTDGPVVSDHFGVMTRIST